MLHDPFCTTPGFLVRRFGYLRSAPAIIRYWWLRLTFQRRRAFWHEVRTTLRDLRRLTPPGQCAWCDRRTRYGNPRLPVSHGICTPCREVHFRFVPLRRLQGIHALN